MQESEYPPQFSKVNTPGWSTVCNAFALAAVISVPAAHAQSDQLGTYVGNINVSGTLIEPRGSYRATVRLKLPISQSDDQSVKAELLSGATPNATVMISDWDVSFSEKSAGADGKYGSWSCSLATTAEIPMTATGTLNVDLVAKTYAFDISLQSIEDLAFNCTDSRTGAYKKNQPIALFVGSRSAGTQADRMLPFSDASHLSANFTLNTKETTAANYGPIIQEWDLRLAR